MKKILFALFAVVALVACNDEVVVDRSPKVAIGFGNAYVDHITRADFSSGRSVEEFKVYATEACRCDGLTEQLFNAETVSTPSASRAGATPWGYKEARYWRPNSDYVFMAIADGEAAPTNTLPQSIPFTVADGADNKDLLIATSFASTNAHAVPIEGNAGEVEQGVVKFSFAHLLTKLQFTVKNGSNPYINYFYEVTGISVAGVAKKGVYDVAGAAWAQEGSSTTALSFGGVEGFLAGDQRGVTVESRQILPVSQELVVTVTYNKKINKTVVATGQTLTATIPARIYKSGTRYNITATINNEGAKDKLQLSVGTIGSWADASVSAK